MKEVADISQKELQELRLSRIALFATITMLVAHGSFIIIFWYLGVMEMTYFNLFFSLPMILLAFFFVWKKKVLSIAFVNYLEIILHAMAAIYYIGWETGFYFYLIFSIVIAQSYPWSKILKGIMFTAFVVISVVFYINFHAPIHPLDSYVVQAMYLMNLMIFSLILASYMLYLASLNVSFEKKLNEANSGLKEYNAIILNQKNEIEEVHQEIKDSINYAKRIQNAILPPDSLIATHLPKSFILYKPKDIIAGDFYWMSPPSLPEGEGPLRVLTPRPMSTSAPTPTPTPKPTSTLTPTSTSTSFPSELAPTSRWGRTEDGILFAAADCTGHGVPGAMVSVVCNNALNRSVREYGLRDPGEILNKTREIVIAEFEKSDEEVKDGMDIAMVSLEYGATASSKKLNTQYSCIILKYAGAHNPLWIIRKGAEEIEEIKANKQPIGKFIKPEPYTTHELKLNKGDCFYIFSDGYPDQFGGERGKKFKSVNFKKLLLSIQNETMEKQKEILDQKFEEWKGDIEQVDDVCVIGVRI